MLKRHFTDAVWKLHALGNELLVNFRENIQAFCRDKQNCPYKNGVLWVGFYCSVKHFNSLYCYCIFIVFLLYLFCSLKNPLLLVCNKVSFFVLLRKKKETPLPWKCLGISVNVLIFFQLLLCMWDYTLPFANWISVNSQQGLQ